MKKSLYSIVMVLCVNTPEMNAQPGLLTILDNDAFKVESDGRLQISTNSTFGTGQIKLIENQYDYARITFSNNIHTNDYWDVAVRVDTNLSNSLFHFNFRNVGDILTVSARSRVGINDANPGYPLEVNGNGETRSLNLYNNLPTTNNATFNYGVISNLSQAANTGFPRLFNLYGFSTDSDSYLSYGVYGFSSNASNFNYGVYGVAGVTGGYAGYFSGNTYCTNSYLPSDPRLKKNIHSIRRDEALRVINVLNPISYEFNTDSFDYMNLSEGVQYGVNAEELEQVLPSLVKDSFQAFDEPTSNTDAGQGIWFKAVNYNGLVPILICAMQQLNAQNKELSEQVSQQQSLLTDLQAKVKDLEHLFLKSYVSSTP